MPWVFNGTGQSIAGIGDGPMSNAEFEERVREYEERGGEGFKGSIAASKLYKRIGEEAAEKLVEEQNTVPEPAPEPAAEEERE